MVDSFCSYTLLTFIHKLQGFITHFLWWMIDLIFYVLHISFSWLNQNRYKWKSWCQINSLVSIQNILQWDGQSFSFVEPLIDPQLETFVQISSKCWLFFLWLQGPWQSKFEKMVEIITWFGQMSSLLEHYFWTDKVTDPSKLVPLKALPKKAMYKKAFSGKA